MYGVVETNSKVKIQPQRVLLLKILAISHYTDLKLRMGCVPQFWQLFKSLYVIGCDITVIPYAGKDVETLWWTAYPNPCYNQYKIYEFALNLMKKTSLFLPFLNGTISIYLNDILVNKATNVNPKKGRIQIQSESAEIFFRKVELTPLSKK